MAKYVVGLLWLLAVIEFTAFAAAVDNLLHGRMEKYREELRKISIQDLLDERRGFIKLPYFADGLLHLYALPVGQGSGLVLRCPNGDITIIDLGSRDSYNKGFWSKSEITTFLYRQQTKIRNIVITHNDKDHYSFFEDVFPTSKDLPGLVNIYISCTFGDLPITLQTWINNIGAMDNVREFNRGHRCGHNETDTCEEIILCPENPKIMAQVLSANAGVCKNAAQDKKTNMNSIVIRITFNKFTMLLSGDFEDCTKDQENGIQQEMVDFYGSAGLQSTVYMLSHHGADRCANKPVLLDAVKPNAVFTSSNPWFRSDWRHPRCSITKNLTVKGYLCKPMYKNSCGQHPRQHLGLTSDDKRQNIFTCGMDPSNETTKCKPELNEDVCWKKVIDNEFAIYTTTPTKNNMNLVHLVTDGEKWGFINKFLQRIKRN